MKHYYTVVFNKPDLLWESFTVVLKTYSTGLYFFHIVFCSLYVKHQKVASRSNIKVHINIRNELEMNNQIEKIKMNIGNLSLLFLILLTTILGCSSYSENAREHLSFNNDWRFTLSDSSVYSQSEYTDTAWRQLNVPHDWSIEGAFSEDHPAGIGGGALPGGIGWYRKSFSITESDSTKKVYITFDGVYQNSEVFINGHLLGKRPNGYLSFQYDLTPYLRFGAINVIAVRVDNGDQPNSRWYSGSGIYRNVWLTKTNPIHIAQWGTYVETPTVTRELALVQLEISVNNSSTEMRNVVIESVLVDDEEREVASTFSEVSLKARSTSKFVHQLKLENPNLWTTQNPYLYKIINYIKTGEKIIDNYETTIGIRFFEFDAQNGFSLNGVPTKILGVCNHHDLGALGAALNVRAKERQLEILKEMGCNGIRTSHNPPAPELLDLCDKMGFIVMNETFDVWKKKKVENDYSNYFDEWHERDLVDHLKRDRNHPSIFSWSIGNEILEQWDSTGIQIGKELAQIAKQYIPNIPLTGGFNDPEPSNFIIQSGGVDLIGFNYKHERFEGFPETFPGKKFIATETTSSLNSRGEYDMPSDSIRRWPLRWDIPFYDGMEGNRCSSYDNCSAPWGSTHAESWKLIKKHDFLSGMYIWTGFDYLGEPTPYQWPSRSSYFGIIDLAGFPKDAYYMYKSEWTQTPVLHLFPHWNWQAGQQVDVWAYTNFQEVELFVNEKSLGVKRKGEDDIHLQWTVPFEPGELKAVGRNTDGTEEISIINTAGKANAIELVADREVISADGNDLCFVTVNVKDERGNLVPYANNLINFECGNNIEIAAVDNGNQTSHEPFQANYRKAYNGKCLVIIRSSKHKGVATLKATSKGLESTEIDIKLN